MIRVLRAKSLNSRRASRPFLDARSANPRAELFALVDFLICKSARRAFDFSPLSIHNLRQPALSHSIPPRAITLFCIYPHHLRFFPRARPAFKFYRFARSIRSGYERICAQTPNFRVLFTRRCARILSKFYVEFQACPHLHSRHRHKRSLLRARKRDLRDTAQEMKFRRYKCATKFQKGQRAAIKFTCGSAP